MQDNKIYLLMFLRLVCVDFYVYVCNYEGKYLGNLCVIIKYLGGLYGNL